MRALLRTLATASLLAALASPSFASAVITIINLDGPGEGFNDATPAAPVGGNAGVTVGQQRLLCFQQAASIWGATLTSSVPILIQAAFNPLSCTATSAVLGSAGPRFVEVNPPGIEFPNYWYHEALACKEAGVDLTIPGDPGLPPGDTGADINAQFNSNLGNVGCLTGSGWYYGFDHNEGTKIDLLAVLEHEFGHGLGFSTVTSGTTGNYLNGPPALPAVWDKFLFDETQGLHWDQNTAAQRVASAINTGNLTWDGASVTASAATFLSHLPEMLVPYGSGVVAVNNASFGGALTLAGLTAEAVVVADPVAPASDGCDVPFTNAAALVGKIAVIDRGVCTFVVKAKNAQDAGAIACVIANNAAGALSPGGADPTITIPCVGITQADGVALKAAIAGGPTTVTLHLNSTLLAGAHPSGRVRMFSPNPFQGGSSVSHYDVSLTPNALMEPAINPDLTDNLDLTVDLFRDIGWFGRGGPVATQLALVAADIRNGRPHLEWYSADGANESMTLYRAALPATFERVGNLLANGTGMVSYDDADVVPGRSYEYKLGIQTPNGERMLGFAHVDVPLSAKLAIKRVSGNTGALAFSVVLAKDVPATVDVMDAAGRRIASQDLRGLGIGEHTVNLSSTPRSGVYWARVSQAGQSVTTHFVLMQ